MALETAVLAIGSELLNGEMSDTNTAVIARALGRVGYVLRESRAVGDIEAAIEEALLSLAARYEVIIATGGLGPTTDDLTARSAAKAFERRMVLNDEAMGQIREYFRRSGWEMHPRNEKQALLPQKATVLPNRCGSAPGFLLHHNGRAVFFLPGVPAEMEAMLEDCVLPQLREWAGASAHPRQERLFKIFGLSEPKAEELLAGIDLPGGIELGFGVDFPFVIAKLRSEGEAAESLLDRAEPAVRRALGNHLFATGDETLAGNVARLLTGAGMTVALAESCTGGQIAAALTEIPGASVFLERGAVTYANSAKIDWLGVSEAILNEQGAVSEECALAMAKGIRQSAGTDIGLAVTGIAGPGGGTPEKPVGTVWLALSAPDTQQVKKYRFGGNRQQIRRLATCMGLDWLRRYLYERMEAVNG